MTTKAQEKDYQTIATLALVLSLLSWVILGIILAPTGFILGIKALGSRNNATVTTAAIAMIVSGIGLAMLIISFMIGLAAVTAYR